METEHRAIDDSFALEILGLELWRDLDARTIEDLHTLWSRAGVLVFRRQSISEDELAKFSARFGDPEVHVRRDWQSSNQDSVLVLSNLFDREGRAVGGLGSGELAWHSDQSYQPMPATGSFLHGVEIPIGAGCTEFANLRLAHAALPDALKHRAEGKQGRFSYVKRASAYDGKQPSAEELAKMAPDVLHDLVNSHPVTGEASLYLDPGTTVGVAGMAAEQGVALLDELAERAAQPAFVYRHHWQPGDVVMWDNGVVLHRRDEIPADRPRLMKRTTVRLPADRHIVPQGTLA
jgi:taurine dioxygenase